MARLAKCYSCGSFDLTRIPGGEHTGPEDRCTHCGAKQSHKPGTITADQHMASKEPEMAMSGDNPHMILLDASELAPMHEVPLGLTGQPTYAEIPTDEEDGKNADGSPKFKVRKVPIGYFKKELIKAGHWYSRGKRHELTGSPVEFDLDNADLDSAVKNFKDLKTAGVLPFVPDVHYFGLPSNASNQNGHIIDLERKGSSLYGTFKLVGEKAIEKTLKNDVSVGLVDGKDKIVNDAYGKTYNGWVLNHVSLTPNPNQPHLEGFQRIAASADGVTRDIDVPYYRLQTGATSATPSNPSADNRKGSRMSPELATKARQTLGLSADVTDDKIDNVVAEKAIALSADVLSITTARDDFKNKLETAISERDAAKADAKKESEKVLALSGDGLNPVNRAAFVMNSDMMWEHAIKQGAITSADVVSIKGVLRDKTNQPTHAAIAASGDNGFPLEYNLAQIIAKFGTPLRAGTQLSADSTPAERAIAASGDQPEKLTEERRRELLGAINLEPAKK